MSSEQWNQRYEGGEVPWDTGVPDPILVEVVDRLGLTSGRVLEVGCGTGTNALWLASRGLDVLAIDVAPRAIELARAKADAHGRSAGVRFEVRDFLAGALEESGFDFVFDRGVFHVFDAAADRALFASRVAEALAPAGQWLSLVGSTEGPPREEGPPRRSARDIVLAIEPALEIVELVSTTFSLGREVEPRAWRCLARKRLVPAQPSTGVQMPA